MTDLRQIRLDKHDRSNLIYLRSVPCDVTDLFPWKRKFLEKEKKTHELRNGAPVFVDDSARM